MQLCHHYGLRLEVKPVLPMVMRGLQVPRRKTLYIFLDARREAEKAGIPFGFTADPLGAGVECCYQLFDYARDQGREVDYLLSIAQGVYAEGVDIATRSGLARLVERAGLDWSEARRHLGNSVWTEWARDNLDAMYRLGFWGVPAFRFAGTQAWGQDRFWLLERAIMVCGPTAPQPRRISGHVVLMTLQGFADGLCFGIEHLVKQTVHPFTGTLHLPLFKVIQAIQAGVLFTFPRIFCWDYTHGNHRQHFEQVTAKRRR